MAVSSYRPTSWVDNDPLFTQKLNQMTSNDQYLYENSAKILYKAHGVTRTQGVKVASGIQTVTPAEGVWTVQNVYFGSFFTVGARPVVVATLLHNNEGEHHLSVHGIATQFPDHRGFEFALGSDRKSNSKPNKFTRTLWINWIAVGY